MNLDQAKAEMLCAFEAGNAVILDSPSGMGKSQMNYALFEYIRDRDAPKGISWGFGTIFAATQTPPDLIGFQFKGQRKFELAGKEIEVTVTDPSVPLWMISSEGKPAFLYDRFYLVIDEYGQGEADVKRAVAEILLNGGTAPWYLPPGSIRVACTNVGTRYGVTKDFDFCIARRTAIHVNFDVDVWTKFVDKPYQYQGKVWQTLPVVKAWANQHPEIVCEKEPKEQGPWCNPRTLCAADRYLQVKTQMQGGTLDPNDPGMMEVLGGTIGMAATMSLVQHLQFRLELPTYDDVVADPVKTPVPTKADYQMLMAYELAGHTKPADLAAVLSYVSRLPKDMNITFVTALLRRDYKGLINVPALQGWISKNAALVAVIASLSQP